MGILLIAAALAPLAGLELPTFVRKALVGLILLSLLLILILAGLTVAFRTALRSVGSRLFFSYFLVGPLPLLLALSLGGICLYAVAGLVTSHLVEDARLAIARELEMELAHSDSTTLRTPAKNYEEGVYQNGEKISGSQRLPQSFPAQWLSTAGNPARGTSLALLPEGAVALTAWRCAGRTGTCVVRAFVEPLEHELRRRAGVWVDLLPPGDPRRRSVVRVQVGPFGFVFRGLRFELTPEELEAFYRFSPPRSKPPALWDRPWLRWADESAALWDLSTGQPVPGGLALVYAASPRGLLRGLDAGTARIDARLWLALASIGIVFSQISILAGLIAVSLVWGISRGVNRLTAATIALASGDFTHRIGSRRRDQLGDLARSFDRMAEELEALIRTRAVKEALERELALARQVQESLLPRQFEPPPGYRIKTRFLPSAALGGDLYDFRRLPDGRIVFLIADVSGHGLAAGLRMAFLRAAVMLLLDEGHPPSAVLARIDRELRERDLPRSFVTALVATLHPPTGTVELLSAGHPPAYWIRESGVVEELLLPSTPLGTFQLRLGQTIVKLSPGDCLVLLSDGWIEASNASGEPFGYERVAAALATPVPTARTLASQLEQAIEQYAPGVQKEDDCTLVVLERSPTLAERDRNSSETRTT